LPDLFRVFPYLRTAHAAGPGGALFIPPQGGGRIDNPTSYSVLYLGDTAPGAIAEAFGRFPEWKSEMLEGSPSLPGSRHALARYRLDDNEPICNLDDPQRLLDLSLRPSDVVSRDYNCTRQWARRIHAQAKWSGVRWWSYYHPQWSSFALWKTGRISLVDVSPLDLNHASLVEAGRTILRPVITRRR
jgi:hypothetical protein